MNSSQGISRSMLRDVLRNILLIVFGVAFFAVALSRKASDTIGIIAGALGILYLAAVIASLVSIGKEAKRQFLLPEI